MYRLKVLILQYCHYNSDYYLYFIFLVFFQKNRKEQLRTFVQLYVICKYMHIFSLILFSCYNSALLSVKQK